MIPVHFLVDVGSSDTNIAETRRHSDENGCARLDRVLPFVFLDRVGPIPFGCFNVHEEFSVREHFAALVLADPHLGPSLLVFGAHSSSSTIRRNLPSGKTSFNRGEPLNSKGPCTNSTMKCRVWAAIVFA